jgi:Tfp pilus assembly protein PilO
MAISFREFPAPIQAGAYLALAAGIVLLGEYIPGSPIQKVRAEVSNTKKQASDLQGQVVALQTYENQKVQLKAETEALQKQLDTLKTIVPDEKQVDEFIHALHDSAKASSVSLRRLTAGTITAKEYYYEVPFTVEADGPYYQVVDFFTRLSRLSRIINVSEVDFANPEEARGGKKYPMRPGTTVTGTFVATTFFTGGANGPPPPPSKTGTKPAVGKR